ncbi:protein phosphatase 1 regulatory subunit pprA-like [Anopheles nili]|uniref:protein phosphatase 1 regulatory subunit pprA-like n=1 Tax=Anopheles nili TaxID=185578 RepID=UPI00237B9115|nr:protein phosphatase 1 regulatory subunit pprA-like [Anopheles nili]
MIKLIKLNASSLDVGLFYGKKSSVNNTYLDKLRITKCLLKAIPRSIGHLKNVKVVTILDTKLEIVDFGSFAMLQNLRKLDLSSNMIKHVFQTAMSEAHFPSLIGIDLQGNRLKIIDMNIFTSMKSLRWLYLSKNKLDRVEGPIASLKLKDLRLSSNRLTKLDCCNWNLSSLTDFILSNNKLKRLPTMVSGTQ